MQTSVPLRNAIKRSSLHKLCEFVSKAAVVLLFHTGLAEHSQSMTAITKQSLTTVNTLQHWSEARDKQQEDKSYYAMSFRH